MRRAALCAAILVAASPSFADEAPGPEVLFTFDDGPNLERTPKVLEALEAHGVKAVFFVNGWHFQGTKPDAERARELLREMVRRGHAVGNHTVHHHFLCGKLGKRIAADEIEKNAELIEQATGMRPPLYRTPYGSRCKHLATTLDALGIKHTHWDIDPQDWRVQNTKLVRDYVIRRLKTLRGRAIVLLHDVHQDTVKALPQILDWIARENAARIARNEAPLRVIDYAYLMPARPIVPPVLDELRAVLIDAVPTGPVARALRWLGLPAGVPWTS